MSRGQQPFQLDLAIEDPRLPVVTSNLVTMDNDIFDAFRLAPKFYHYEESIS